jgi:DNA invertase Pin-like site-specific DNA recombinase
MSEKIQPSHIEREAYVYVRQSSMQQVRTRLEGQRRQYDLRERALELGFQRVVVIDEDLGRSGSGSVERPGFGRLLAAVCSGKVGAVLALEASRLARNNRDWHHLIDLCAMAGTLVIDHDGIYDPSLLNDRLLLGLKGTMSEFEISLLRQRAMEARRQKVGRGLVLTQVPVGYVRTEDEGIEKTPDRQVQEAIAGIFRKFRELGSVRQVLLWYRDEKLLIPALSRESGHRKLVWIEPVYPRIFGILKNPTYAGVFVWEEITLALPLSMAGHARRVATLARWSSGKLTFRITTKGILRGKSLCVISNRSAPTPVGMHAWGVRMAQ